MELAEGADQGDGFGGVAFGEERLDGGAAGDDQDVVVRDVGVCVGEVRVGFDGEGGGRGYARGGGGDGAFEGGGV